MMDDQIDTTTGDTYVASSDPASYELFAIDNFLAPLAQHENISIEKTLLKPCLSKLSEMDRKCEERGGIDLLVLAIGVDGHYAQVM